MDGFTTPPNADGQHLLSDGCTPPDFYRNSRLTAKLGKNVLPLSDRLASLSKMGAPFKPLNTTVL